MDVTQSSIMLKGTSKMVQEFFYYGINSILFQRGIYPSEMFSKVKRYNMALLVTNDKSLNAFLDPLMKQVEELLSQKRLKRLVVLIIDVEKKLTLERWQFDVACEESADNDENEFTTAAHDKRIKQEISDVLRQGVPESAIRCLPRGSQSPANFTW